VIRASFVPVLVVCTAASVAPAERLDFRAPEGVPLAKHFAFALELELDAIRDTWYPGFVESNSSAGLHGAVFGLTCRESITDTYHAVQHGFPFDFTRRYDLLRLTARTGKGPLDVEERISPLEGRSFSFDWDEEEDVWVHTLLEEPYIPRNFWLDLEGDRDLLGWLPSEYEVEVGERWEVDPLVLADTLLPEIRTFELPAFEFDVNLEGPILSWAPWRVAGVWCQGIEGTVRAEYTKKREVAGRTLAVIPLRVDLRGGFDKGMLEIDPEDLGYPRQLGVTIAASTLCGWTFEGTGELLWDLDRGHFHSLAIEGEVHLVVGAYLNWMLVQLTGGQGHDEEWSGTISLEVGLGALSVE